MLLIVVVYYWTTMSPGPKYGRSHGILTIYKCPMIVLLYSNVVMLFDKQLVFSE